MSEENIDRTGFYYFSPLTWPTKVTRAIIEIRLRLPLTWRHTGWRVVEEASILEEPSGKDVLVGRGHGAAKAIVLDRRVQVEVVSSSSGVGSGGGWKSVL